MPYVLGIDIGTSFTAAAIARLGNDKQEAPQPLGLGLHGGVVPSVIHLGDDGEVLVGESAERRGLSSPDRLVREFKRRVGDAVPIVVGELLVAPEDVFAIMARWVVDRAEEREGEPPQAIIVSHPASWGEYKSSLVRQALAGVGLADVALLSEPEAAALHYAAQERVDPGSTIAVYDLGGGTFDIAILKKSGPDSFNVLGRPVGLERLGGADFDEAVFEHVAASIGDAFTELDVTDPACRTALSRVRRECVEAKEALSFDSEASIPVFLPGVQTQVRLVRSEFEGMIEGSVLETIKSLNEAIEKAGITAEDLAAVLLIGGSSRIPLVTQLLSEELDRPINIDADPKASISLGAAFAAAATLQREEREARIAAGAESATEAEHAAEAEQAAEPDKAREPGLAASTEAGAAPANDHAQPRRARASAALTPFARSTDPEADATTQRAKVGRARVGVGAMAAAAMFATFIVVIGPATRTSSDLGQLTAGAAMADGVGGGGGPTLPLAVGGDAASADAPVTPLSPDEAAQESVEPPFGPKVSDEPTTAPWEPKVPDAANSKRLAPKAPTAKTPPASGTSDPTPTTTPSPSVAPSKSPSATTGDPSPSTTPSAPSKPSPSTTPSTPPKTPSPPPSPSDPAPSSSPTTSPTTPPSTPDPPAPDPSTPPPKPIDPEPSTPTPTPTPDPVDPGPATPAPVDPDPTSAPTEPPAEPTTPPAPEPPTPTAEPALPV